MRGRIGRGGLALCLSLSAWAAPARAVVISAGTASGAPGEQVAIEVTLATEGASVLATQNRIDFTRQASVAAKADGSPDCAVDPEINKNATAFRFLPLGCDPAADCTAVRVFVLAFDNLLPIDDGSRLYACRVAIAADATPGTYPLAMAEAGSSAAAGVVLPTTATDGAVTVVRPPAARVVIGAAAGQPGATAQVPVVLAVLESDAGIAGVSVDIGFDAATAVPATLAGAPDCAPDAQHQLAVGFLPAGCTPAVDCTAVRALVWTPQTTPFGDGATLFRCAIAIADTAAAGTYPLVATAAEGSDVDGNALPVTGVDGAVTVEEAPPACAGDCDGSGAVSINELLLGVNIVIGSAAVDQCAAVDTNGDGTVTISELIQAVNAALGSCPT